MTQSHTYHLRVSTLIVLVVTTLGASAARAQENDQSATEELTLDKFPVQDQCIACHLDLGYMPDGIATYDVHLKEGLSCAGCHGGDPTSDDEDVAMSKAAGFVGKPSPREIPAFCGKCHSSPSYMHDFQPMIRTDQVAQYSISIHGKRLAQGDTKVANCASCHTAHSILPAADTRSTVNALNIPQTCRTCHADPIYMRDYGLRTDQYRLYASSVHGVAVLEKHDLGAPACNDCHGNHGTLPPEISSIPQLCGSCHVNNLEFYSHSPMTKAFAEQGLHGCEACHGYHAVAKASVTMVGTDAGAVCMDCHRSGDAGSTAAGQIRSEMDTLIAVLDSASTMQDEVVRAGMDDLDIDYLIKDAHQSLIRAQTTVHTFDPKRVAELTDDGVSKAREAISLSNAQIDDNWNRRFGFALVSLFITILAVGLYLKILEIRPKKTTGHPN